MKTKKWITYTLVVLFTLVALTAVGVAGFRIGMTQSASFASLKAGFNHRQFNGNDGQNGFVHPPVNGPMQNFGHNFQQRGFDDRGFGRGFDRGGRGGFFPPIFGLIHIALLGLLLWFGYKLVKNSGWRLVKVTAEPVAAATAAPVEPAPAPTQEGEEKKE